MKKTFFFIVISGVFIISVSSADTIVPGGFVSGIWTVAGSPYLVQGNISIQVDSTLTIQPGVEVKFQGNYLFTVNGFLQAIGTVTDSIHFTGSLNWLGITFINAPDSSHLEYCILDSAWANIGALVCQNSNPVISHSTIRDNWCLLDGGGITLWANSNARILYCTISNNTATSGCGGIGIQSSSPEISFSSIIGNTAYQGGGISVTGGSNPVISYSTISDNSSSTNGAGIYAGTGSSLTIRSSTIDHNDASWDGGGIFISSSTGVFTLTSCMILVNRSATGRSGGEDTTAAGSGIHIVDADSVVIGAGCLFDGNLANASIGPAIYAGNCARLLIDHCDFVNNSSNDVFAGGITLNGSTNLTLVNSVFKGQGDCDIDFRLGYNSASVSYCDFIGYYAFSSPPDGLGVIDTVNANGDSCDGYFNIFIDPWFVDYANQNYLLTENSACIDAGDPSSPLDPDGTITDMGAWYFHQSPLIIASDSLLDFGIVDIGQQIDLPLTIRNEGTVALRLQSVSNMNSVFTHNWSLADSLIMPNDSLTIMVTFTPVDTNFIVDTLSIENNDRPLQVQLSGKGEIVVGIEDQSELPRVYSLYPAYPNPFNPTTEITYSLPKPGQVSLRIFDILGQEIITLINERKEVGTHTVSWNAEGHPSGIYIIRLMAGGFTETKKVVLTK